MVLCENGDGEAAILDFMPVGVCLVDQEFRVAVWNSCLESWTGIARRDIIGANLLDRFPHLQKPIYRARMEVVLQGGPPAIFSAYLHNWLIPSQLLGGKPRLQHAIVSPYAPLGPGGPRYAAITLQDVTEVFTRMREFSHLRDQALREVEERRRAEVRLRELAMTDELTGLYNRRHFMREAEREIERAARFGHEIGLLMIDIDHFKAVNDNHGHAMGDEALRLMARTIKDALRDVDLVARLGGEEFAVVLPETMEEGAATAAERIRRRVEAMIMPLPRGDLRFSVSVGLATASGADLDLDALLRRADTALYAAKRNGRNRVEVG